MATATLSAVNARSLRQHLTLGVCSSNFVGCLEGCPSDRKGVDVQRAVDLSKSPQRCRAETTASLCFKPGSTVVHFPAVTETAASAREGTLSLKQGYLPAESLPAAAGTL